MRKANVSYPDWVKVIYDWNKLTLSGNTAGELWLSWVWSHVNKQNEGPTHREQHMRQMASHDATDKSQRGASHEVLDRPGFVEVPTQRRKHPTRYLAYSVGITPLRRVL